MRAEARLREILEELLAALNSPDPFSVDLPRVLKELAELLPSLSEYGLEMDAEALYYVAELIAKQEEWVKGRSALLVLGPFVAVLLLFAAPVTLMGCVSPFVIRLLVERVERAGNVSGQVYAVSTAGSLLGTLLPVFVLIPAVGTRNTFVTFSLLLMGVALLGLARISLRRVLPFVWMPLLVIILALVARGQPIKPQEGAIYETESAYNYIQVVEHNGWRYLYLNEGQGIHSIYNPAATHVGGTWDYFLAAPFFNPPPFTAERVQSLAMIGLAGGTIPKEYTLFFGPIPIDGVELDPEIVRVGREFFAMDEPNLNVIVADGRAFLARTDHTYSVVGIDAYRLPYIPWHLTTVEFFQQVRDHLTEDGVVVVNVGHTPGDDSLTATIAATMGQVFTSVHAMDVPSSFNTILVATVQPTTADNLLANRALLSDPTLAQMVTAAWETLRPLQPGGMVLCDDRAPIEMLTHEIVLRYVLGR